MNRLTESEIAKYIKPRDGGTGVDGISREDLTSIDLDTVREVVKKLDIITDVGGKQLFKRGNFTPRAGTIYLKPSFAGRQVLMGKTGRDLHFSNGRWFC